MTRDEIVKLEKYLRQTFKLDALSIKERKKKDDSAEVFIGEEFIGVLFRDDEDGEVSYQFQMAILQLDLE